MRRHPTGKTVRLLLLVVWAITALVWAVVRANRQAVVIDEAETFEIFAGRFDPSHWEAGSNNHVLSSILVRLTTSAFGLSHLTLRLPTLMACALYISAALCFCVLVSSTLSLQWPLFTCLAFNPFIYDFFVVARGYSLALATLFWAFVVLYMALQPSRAGHQSALLWASGICSATLMLSFSANFSFAIAIGSAYLLIQAALLHQYRASGFRSLTETVTFGSAAIVPGALVVLFLDSFTLLHWPPGQLVDGATSLSETVATIWDASLYEPNPHIVNPLLLPVIRAAGPVILIGLAVILCARIGAFLRESVAGHRANAPSPNFVVGVLVGGTLVSSVAIHWLALKTLGLLLPRNRTALFLALLVTMFGGIVLAADAPDSRLARWLASSGRALLFAAAVYFLLCSRLSYVREWQYLTDVRSAYDILAGLNHSEGLKDVGSSWRYSASLNFYRRMSGQESISELPPASSGPPPVGKEAYVLNFPEDSAFIQAHSLTVVYHGTSTDMVVAVPPRIARRIQRASQTTTASPEDMTAVPGVYDDIDDVISYSGVWTRDRQFHEAARGTITYSNDPHASWQVTFEGTGVQWLYTRARNRGLAQVLLDGKVAAELDLYSEVTAWQTAAYFAGLHPGVHRLEVRTTGRKNAKSLGEFIDVDGVVIESKPATGLR